MQKNATPSNNLVILEWVNCRQSPVRPLCQTSCWKLRSTPIGLFPAEDELPFSEVTFLELALSLCARRHQHWKIPFMHCVSQLPKNKPRMLNWFWPWFDFLFVSTEIGYWNPVLSSWHKPSWHGTLNINTTGDNRYVESEKFMSKEITAERLPCKCVSLTEHLYDTDTGEFR